MSRQRIDILLINPKNIKSRVHEVMPPLGLASIGGVLENHGFSVKLLDLEIKSDDFDLYTYIKNLSPRVVGISGTSHSRFESFRIAGVTKRVSRKTYTVYGGCHATFTAQDTLRHIKDIDYIVRGEGEETFLELSNFLISHKGIIDNIEGVSFRRQNQIAHNPPRQRIKNLDSIPHSRHLIEMEKYDIKLEFLNIPAVSIVTSRGCPINCNFCSASTMFGSVYTMRSTENIVDEIQYCMKNFSIKGIKFFDSTLTLNRNHILSLTKELKKRNIDIPWECEIRVDTVDKGLLKSMRQAGCHHVYFAVESVSKRILKIIGKKISIPQAIDVLKWCKELNIETKVFFSFGHPTQTWTEALQTLAFIDKYYDYISIAATGRGMRIYPGTRLEKYAIENKLLPDDFSWSKPFKNIKEGFFVTDNVPFLLDKHFGIQELNKTHYIISLLRELKKMHVQF